MAKIFLIIAAVLCVGSAVLGFLNKGKLDTTRGDLATSQSKVADLGTELGETKTKLTTTETEKAAALTNLENTKTELARTAQELGDAKSNVETLKTQIAEKERSIAEKDEQIAQLKANPMTIEGAPASPTELTAEIESLKVQVAGLEGENRILNEKLISEQGRIKGLQSEIDRRVQGIMARGLQGQVLAVNQAWNFVILSLGDRQGVVGNAEMLVRRGDSLVGRVRVTTVEPSTSVADIIPGSIKSGMRIQPGDTVIYPGAPSAGASSSAAAAAPL